MDNEQVRREFIIDVIKTFKHPDGRFFRKFNAAAFREMIKHNDYPGIKNMLENIRKRYDGPDEKFLRKIKKYDKIYAEALRQRVEMIKAERRAKIEELQRKLDDLMKKDP